MPELPEIYNLARQMDTELKGKRIAEIEVRQTKCLNISVEDFTSLVQSKEIGQVRSKGKWIFADLNPDVKLLLNLGMGGDTLYHKKGEALPDKYQARLVFDDGSSLTVKFWWFGYLHAIHNACLKDHKMTSVLGISPVDPGFTLSVFEKLVKAKKGTIKSLIIDQKSIAGIGNVYAQDILFNARLHPNRKVASLSDIEISLLYEVIKDNINDAVRLGGLKFEKDLYGNSGKIESFQVGYREGKPCPVCGMEIEKIKTGSTSTYVCPECQRVR